MPDRDTPGESRQPERIACMRVAAEQGRRLERRQVGPQTGGAAQRACLAQGLLCSRSNMYMSPVRTEPNRTVRRLPTAEHTLLEAETSIPG